ncbi:MAG: cobalamin synthesis protein P47K [Candidatus Hydrogenedentes bacterium]|nr:cobalamin synthesis protein P47K [Candidatus Hydrogenedentota bacterium]
MKLVLVGGFLGAGKTTLLWESARRLAQRNITVGLISNDQAPDLVDTAFLSRSGAVVREVAGSCFCCNFDGFRRAIDSLAQAGAECVIAEPVGSCTDLSATIIQPLKALCPEYALAPLSVLVDPARVRRALRERHPLLHADAAYILRVQLEEADQIVVNKVDAFSNDEQREIVSYLAAEFSHAPVVSISALLGDGLDAWLDGVLDDRPSGSKIAAVDYVRYANGEAVLGWLNAVVELRWVGSLHAEWEAYIAAIFDALRNELCAEECEVGHIKALLESPQGRVMANLTSLHDPTRVRSEGLPNQLTAILTVNARAQIAPEGIENAFRSALRHASHGSVSPSIRAFHCIKPGRPVPTYRYDTVVA